MSDITNLNIRLYQTGDDENIVELLKKTFPKWNKLKDPLNYWRWKYLDTPLGSYVVVAVVDNKIAGCYHCTILNAKLGSEVTSLFWGDELAVDTDYRGLGLWTKMRDHVNKILVTKTKYRYGTTPNPIVMKSWKKRQLKMFPFPVTRMVKINDVGLHLRMKPMKNGLLVKYGYSCLKILNKITNQFSPPIKRGDEFKIAEISKFDEGIDSFWEKIKDDYNFILEKKQTFLNWRLCDPRGKHIVMQAMNGEEVLGFMVMGLLEREGYTEGQIKDLIALKNRLDIADALLDYVCKYFDDLGINTVYYQIVEDHPYQKLSKRKGFINSRSKLNIVFDYTEEEQKANEIQFLKHSVPSQVYINYADTL